MSAKIYFSFWVLCALANAYTVAVGFAKDNYHLVGFGGFFFLLSLASAIYWMTQLED